MGELNQQINPEPVVEVDTNLTPPADTIPGIQVSQSAVSNEEDILFSTDDQDYVLDKNDTPMTLEQQREEIKRLQAEMAKREEFQNQQQVFKSGFETMADKFGDVAKTQQEAYKKLQEQQAAELAKLRQQQQVQPQQPGYSNEDFANEVFSNPGQAIQKYLVANVGPLFQQQQQTIQQLRQSLDAVSSRSQYGNLYTKYEHEIQLQAQQLGAQGVKNPYELAAQIVRGRHVEDFVVQDTQPQVLQNQSQQPIQSQPQPQRPLVQQSFSPTAQQIPKNPNPQTRGKKRIPQSVYNEWIALANEKGLDPVQFTQMKAEYYND